MRNAQRSRANNNNNRTPVLAKSPSVRNSPKNASIIGVNQGIRVKHTEYITGVSEFNAGFIVNNNHLGKTVELHINPGDGVMFPWLSRMAPNFEFFTVNSMYLQYTPTVSHSTSGGVIMSAEYDPGKLTDSELSLPQLLNKATSVKGQVGQICGLRVQPIGRKFHVRSNHASTHTKESIRHTDAGVVTVALYNIGTASDYDYGDVSVTYDITLFGPILDFTNIKTHKHDQAVVSENLGATTFHPCLGVLPEGYNAASNATLGVTSSMRTDMAISGFPVTSNRLSFEEPFHGKLLIKHGPQTGPMVGDPSIAAQDSFTKINSDDAPVARTSAASTIGTAVTGMVHMMDVVAKGGDILDLAWDTINAFSSTDMIFELLEMATGLLLL
jgi:hypothetical protein